jgi:arginase
MPEMRQITLIAAPTNLGLMPQQGGSEPGARKAPEALQALGLAERLGARPARAVEAPEYHPEIDLETGVRNGPAIRRYAESLAAALGEEMEPGVFPVIIGGDCSLLLGSGLALRRRGRHGLIYFDGHIDFKLPAASLTKGAAGMDLAFATGHGPALLADFGEHTPLFREEDVVAFGFRDMRDPATYSSEAIFGTKVQRMDLAELRRRGVAQAARDALEAAAPKGVEGALVHFDVDALDSKIMPAVDSPDADGFSPAEAIEALRIWCADPRVVGMEMTIYDPDRDPDRSCGKLLIDILSAALRGG